MSYGGYRVGYKPAPRRVVVAVTSPSWTFVAADTDGNALGDLSEARSRRVTVRLRDSAEAGFAISGRDEQAAHVTELASDLLVYRERELLFRGRVGASGDRLSPNTHSVSFDAQDYRALLRRRILYADKAYSQVDEEAIGWDLVAYTQALSGGDLGITRDGTPTGTLRDRTYDAGKSIGEALDQLTEVIGGPDVEVGPDLVWRAWPRRGTDKSVVLAYGENVASLTRDVQPGDFANAVRVTGKGTEEGVVHTTPEVREAANLPTAPEGRFDLQSGDPDIITQSVLAAKADGLLAEHGVVRPGYTLTLAEGAWDGPDHLWLGDTVRLQIDSGRLQVDTQVRVYELDLEPGDDGGETISVRLGRPRTRPTLADRRRLAELESAVADLNRR